MDPDQEPRQSKSIVHAFTLYHQQVDSHSPRVGCGGLGYTRHETTGFVGFQFHCCVPVVYFRAVPVWSLHVDHICTEMCLKVVCHMLEELRYHMFRMCVPVYNVCVCTQCVFLQGVVGAHVTHLCVAVIMPRQEPTILEGSRTYFPFIRK